MEYFVYRLNFLLWRFRSVVSFLTLVFFWQAIYGIRQEVFGYQKSQMLTYIIGITFLRGIVFGSRTADLAGMIKSGDVVNKFLTRPWNVIKAWFFRDLAAKFLDTLFVFLELSLILRFISLPFYLPKDWRFLLLFGISCLLSIVLYFFINFFFSIIAFWIDNIWAPRWLFGVIFLEFMSGAFFPLDVLPKTLFNFIKLTPFPYLIYFPIKIYLGQVDVLGTIKILGLMFFWLCLILPLTNLVWKKGLKAYSAYGG